MKTDHRGYFYKGCLMLHWRSLALCFLVCWHYIHKFSG